MLGGVDGCNKLGQFLTILSTVLIAVNRDPQLIMLMAIYLYLIAVVSLKFLHPDCFVICMNLCILHKLFIVLFCFFSFKGVNRNPRELRTIFCSL